MLIGAAPAFSEPVRAGMRERAAALRRGGMPAVVQSSLERWFTPDTMLRRPHVVDRVTKLVLANDPSVQAAMWEMVAGFDVRDRLGELRLPTLVLVGERDPSTPPPVAAELAAGIRGAELAVLPDASHIATLEVPDAVDAEVLRFLRAPRRD